MNLANAPYIRPFLLALYRYFNKRLFKNGWRKIADYELCTCGGLSQEPSFCYPSVFSGQSIKYRDLYRRAPEAPQMGKIPPVGNLEWASGEIS